VGEAGAVSTGLGKAAARQERTRGLVQGGAEAVGVLHMAGRAAVARRAEEQRREREVDERGPGCNFQKGQGLHCNV
jgi:hypothetical protein